MKKLVAIFLLLSAALAFAQGGQRIGQATQSSNGFVKVVSGAAVTVCTYPACGAITIYEDVALTVPITQPLHADVNGNYMYFVAAGNYFENVNSPGVMAQVNVISLNQGTTANFASPPPIGNVAPNTGAFTSLRAADAAFQEFPTPDVRAFGAVADGQRRILRSRWNLHTCSNGFRHSHRRGRCVLEDLDSIGNVYSRNVAELLDV